MDRKSLYVSLIILAALFLGVAGVMAQEPEDTSESSPQNISAAVKLNSRISYQGVLKENNTLVTGNRNMVFRFYANSNCSTLLQEIPQNNVPVNGGVFSLNLEVNPAYFNGQGVWLRVDVSGAPIVSCQEIVAVPYALSLRPGADVEGSSPDNSTIYASNTAPTGNSYGVSGLSSSSSGKGVYGWATNNSAGSTANGVFGQAASFSGAGVYGLATNTNAGSPANGVFGQSQAPDGNGVFGEAVTTSGGSDATGVFGRSSAPNGNGVFGRATSGSGSAYGVYGVSHSTSGRGVSGFANTGSGANYGVHGESKSPSGYGGFFYNSTSTGVALKAQSATTSTTTRIIEAHSASGRVFYVASNGDVVIDGNFSTAGADFAEMLPGVEGLEPGDVLIIGQDGNLTRSLQPHQTSVVGVYSTEPGFLGGATGTETGQVPLAMIGRVPVKASAENGSIQPGDLLVASATPGHAMRANATPPLGSVIGKALAPLEEGTGLIQMLVILQ